MSKNLDFVIGCDVDVINISCNIKMLPDFMAGFHAEKFRLRCVRDRCALSLQCL